MLRSRFMFSSAMTKVLGLAALALLFIVPVGANDVPEDGRIVFVGNQSGSFQLYTINPDGTNIIKITHLAATDFDLWAPDFSPDGRRIVFCYGHGPSAGTAQTEIYVIDADGSGLTQLTHDGLFDCAPRWSPDGSHIVFARLNTTTQQLVVATMRADGSDVRELTNPLWGVFRSGYTPDGTRIVFETQQAGFVSVLWIMNADGSHQRRLTPAPLQAGLPAASPDGEHILFFSNQNAPQAVPNAIFVMNLNGSDIDQLTHAVGTHHDSFPNYSPDGKQIVFTSDRLNSPDNFDLFTMNADGSNIKRIATGITVGGCFDGNCVNPAWGPKPEN